MWPKSKSKLVYSADYDPESGTVKTRDWREKSEKRISSGSGG
jgi:hypothetical protein